MPSNKKPRKPYRPRHSRYPDLHDVGLIFRPIHLLFDQLFAGEVYTLQGRPIFKDWQGEWCAIVPALDGWVDCWTRIAAGERIELELSAVTRLARCLEYGVPLTENQVGAAWKQIMAIQQIVTKIPRARIGDYMRTEMIAIEVERLGLIHAA